ncbi:hypothetical protein TPAR_08801 [Tolypocladium paradoxum]|uniref:Mitochondrial dicarboxylate transporter n=1 Tax=Tolypocladium paradoxum TaxID=94208 RepID=A0A2S4KLB4_9HYPO|nr:hypothetical protein TPAR_08801 [Tolypocladium paradoxum]
MNRASQHRAILQEKPTTSAAHSPQYPKWFGGSASCLAVVFSHPLDLTISWFAEAVNYGSTRFAIYESIKENAAQVTHGPVSMGILLPAAAISGVCGAVVGNPADIANVRMQNDQSLPIGKRQNYRSVIDVLSRIAREEGGRGFLRGVMPNTIRAGVMTSCQLASYDGFKEMLQTQLGMSGDALGTQLAASLLAGLAATTLCSPVDVLKTRTMSSKSAEGVSGGRLTVDIQGLAAELYKAGTAYCGYAAAAGTA